MGFFKRILYYTITQFQFWISSGGCNCWKSSVVVIPHSVFSNPRYQPPETQNERTARCIIL